VSTRIPEGSQLAGQAAAQGLQGPERDLQAAHPRRRVPVPAEHQDHPGTLPDHVPRGRLRGEERGAQRGAHRPLEIVEGHLGERRALHDAVGDHVDGDVEPARPRHRVGVREDRGLVEGVESRGLRGAARGPDLSGHGVQRGRGPAGQVHRGSFTGEGAGHGPADRAPAAIDHGVLAFQQHVIPPCRLG
jgi:hypothetical protein